jgi:O-antigen/teichoic acid export membrane protein
MLSAAGGDRDGHRSRALETLGQRLASHGSVYVLATVMAAAFGLLQIALLTRVLPLEEFGRLVVLIFYAGLVTALCNLGFLQGTVMSVLLIGRGGDDDPDEEVGDNEPRRPPPPGGDNRRLLGTGLAVGLVIAATVTALSVLLAGPLGTLLLGDASYGEAVVWATAAGSLASVWRLLATIPRYERRPLLYLAMQAGYWTVSLGAAVTLAASGYGIAGAMAGIAIGHVIAGAAGLWLGRHRFRPALCGSDALYLGRRGAPFIAISLPFFLARHADLYILSLYVPASDLALYMVATRLARVPALASSGALSAWGPLVRGPLRAALERENAIDVARARLVSYFVLLATWNVVAITIWADLLVRVAPPSYADAALILPLLTVATAIHGGVTVLYRMSRFQRKVRRFRQVALLSAVLTIGSALLLTPPYGVYGAVASAILAPTCGLLLIVVLSQRGPQPLALPTRRFALCAGLALACTAAALAARPLPQGVEVWVNLFLTLAFPVLLIITGVLPAVEVRRLVGLVRGFWTPRTERGRLNTALANLDEDELELLDALARRGEDPDALAERTGEQGDDVRRRFVALLRSLRLIGRPVPADHRIADYLLSSAPHAERDSLGLLLSTRAGIEPLELDGLATLVRNLRGLPAGAWEDARAAARDRRAQAGALEADPPAVL